MNKPRPTKPVADRPVTSAKTDAAKSEPRKSRKKNELMIVGSVLGVLAIGLLIAGRDLILGTSQQTAAPGSNRAVSGQPQSKPTVAAQPPTVAPKAAAAETSPFEIDDDGQTLWISPTSGKPLDLAFLPPGGQLVVALRPAALLKHPEGEKIQASLGPLGTAAAQAVEQITGLSLAEMDRLVVGLQTTAGSEWIPTFVVRSTAPISREAILAKQAETTAKDHAGKSYWVTNGRAYYFPGGSESKVFVVAPECEIGDVIDLGGQAPPLRRDIERLIDHTDGDRQVTIVLAPNSLFGEGQTIFSGQMSRLRNPLFWFLGDELSGVAMSMNWDANFFLELIATPTLETSPEKAARIFTERVSKIPQLVEEYVVNLNAQPYGRLVIARLPEMLRKLVHYTRSGFDSEHAVLRCYLPPAAGHNLLMAAELTLAESPGAATVVEKLAVVPSAAGEAASAVSVRDGLAKITSLKFARDTLESALDLLSKDIGVPIVIRGADLQADGITKNQSFGIDLADKPAAAILVEILRLANPDKTATGPNDVRQKLVYVVEPLPDKTDQIVVTTRAKAAERKDELPEVFRVE